MASSKATPAVELQNVTKNYGSVQALKHVSLTVERGEVVAVLGPNGAGKSTSIALMLGMRRPTSGSVTLFGENPRHANHRKRVGVMLQESGVPESLTVHELVELFGRFHDNPMVTQEAIKMAGLDGKAKNRLGRLSGGQKQRVYFALALVGNPEVLFLDEPTTGLDVEARRNFWDQIDKQITLGKTVILTTQRKAAPWGYFFYCELVKIFRNPPSVVFGIGFPTFFFLIFGFSLAANLSATILASYAAYGAFIVSFQTFSISLATERAMGWNKLLRTTPMSSTLYLGSKLLVILLTGIISMLLLFAVAGFSGKVHMSLAIWAELLGMMVLGMIPLSFLGLFLGFIGSANLTVALSTILMLLMSFASGLWIPLQFLPEFIQRIAPYLPSYHLGQLAWSTVGSSNGDGNLWGHLLILLGFAVAFAVLAGWAYLRDENKNFA